jgi:YHS domain-containing protein
MNKAVGREYYFCYEKNIETHRFKKNLADIAGKILTKIK